MPTTLHLLRHGEVHNPAQIFYARLPRFRLSERGRQQAQAAADYLASQPLSAVYSSPLLRARQTAQLVAAPHGLKVKHSAHLLEILTSYQGQPHHVMDAMNWDMYRDIQPPYESPSDLIARLKLFFGEVLRRHRGQTLAAVTHGDIVVFAQLWARGLALTQENRMSIRPYPATASISTLIFEDGRELPEFRFHVPYVV